MGYRCDAGAGTFCFGIARGGDGARAFPVSALVLISLGGLWLAIWRRRWRWLGIPAMLAGALLAVAAPRPDLLIAPDARTIALRGPDGLLHFPRPPKDRYSATRWLLRDGDGRDWRKAIGMTGTQCDGLGCVITQNGLMIAAALRPDALSDDCAKADIVVSAAPVVSCEGPRLVLGATEIAAAGGYSVTFSPLHASSVNQWRGVRPWVIDNSPSAQ